MNMYTHSANDLRAINTFVNENGIPKENIVNIFQLKDGTFSVIYYED